MTPTQIEQAAQDHADKYFIQDAEIFCNEPWNNAKDLYAKTLADFAKCCMSKQWISVDERLPEPDTICLVFGYQDFGDGNITRYTMMAWYDGEDFSDAYDDRKYRPERWMPIPLVPPQLNPEKEER